MSESTFPVKERIAERAHLKGMEEYQRLYRLSLDNPEWFWGEQAKALSWFHPWQSVFDADYDEVDFAWYSGGRLNASFNCVDRHLHRLGNETAIIWAQDEPGPVQAHLLPRAEAQRLPRGQRAPEPRRPQGRPGLHLHAHDPGARLHHARLRPDRGGALRGLRRLQRRVAARPHPRRALPDGGHRQRGAARRQADPPQEDRGPRHRGDLPGGDRARGPPHRHRGRDALGARLLARGRVPEAALHLHERVDGRRGSRSSSSTPRAAPASPRGSCTRPAGYLVYAAYTHRLVFDYHPGDIYFCAADVGWVTGHSYIVYGPLANGATTVMFESTPTYPDPGRYWRIVDDLGVNILYTAPTALRALAQAGNDFVKRYRRDSLRILGSVGEPINPEIWRWYHDVVGEKRCAVVDTWWQTETGGILITPLPGVTPTKPGSATLPFFGVKPVIVDPADGKVLEGNGVSGALVSRVALARPGADGLGRPPALPRDLLQPVPRLLLHGRRGAARRGRLLLDHRAHRRRAERLGASPRHRGGRERARGPRVGGRGRGGRLPPSHQGTGHLRLREPDRGLGGDRPRADRRARSRSRCATSSGRSPRRT